MNSNFYAWKPIPAGDIHLSFSGCQNADDVHRCFRSGLGFPDYYGENWDALWGCLRDFASSQTEQRNIFISGSETLSKEMKNYLQEAIELCRELATQYPTVQFMIES